MLWFWDRGRRPTVRKVGVKFFFFFKKKKKDLLTLLWPPGFLDSYWPSVDSGPISPADVARWPYGVDILLTIAFLASLHRLGEGDERWGPFHNTQISLNIVTCEWYNCKCQRRFSDDHGLRLCDVQECTFDQMSGCDKCAR